MTIKLKQITITSGREILTYEYDYQGKTYTVEIEKILLNELWNQRRTYLGRDLTQSEIQGIVKAYIDARRDKDAPAGQAISFSSDLEVDIDATAGFSGLTAASTAGLGKPLTPTWANDFIPVYKTATDDWRMEVKPSGGGTPSDTVVSETGFGQSSAAGVATPYSRGDHTHGTPVNPVTAHEAAADPHTGYQKESEKGAVSGYASLDAGGKVPVAEMGSGTPDGTKYLRDDRTWVTPAGGGAKESHISFIAVAAEVSF